MDEVAISLKNVSKCFKRYARPVDRLKEMLLPGKSRAENFWALQDINLEVFRGETLGIIGQNGSGKSTLLQVIAGILTPTTGEVRVTGRVSALLELGSGFNPEFTGRQNVFFNGRILGLTQTEIEDRFDAIAAFADIGDFIDQPVKTYSSGMFVRLAFAVAVHVNPEILIVDEALAVGDVVFQHRCMRHIRTLMESGVTVLFVSHDATAVKTLCDSAIMLHQGKIFNTGSPDTVLIEYMKKMTEIELGLAGHLLKSSSQIPQVNSANPLQSPISTYNVLDYKNLTRRGNQKILIERVELWDGFNQNLNKDAIFHFNDTIVMVVECKLYEQLYGCIIGFLVCDKNGNAVIGRNTYDKGDFAQPLSPGSKVRATFQFKLPLRPGSYSLTVAVAESQTSISSDWIDNAVIIQVLPPPVEKSIHGMGMVGVPVKVDIQVHEGEGNLIENVVA
jgi:lipopolysaccharide transport system ATP-binding protein